MEYVNTARRKSSHGLQTDLNAHLVRFVSDHHKAIQLVTRNRLDRSLHCNEKRANLASRVAGTEAWPADGL